MAFKARLNFSGKEYDVLHCAYALNRDVDAKGRPSSGVYGGTIDIEIESTEDTSIIEAMVNNQYKPITGTLLIKKTEEDAKMKEVNFEDGYHEGSRFRRTMPLVKEHGAAVVALTIDEQGQARTKQDKVRIASR